MDDTKELLQYSAYLNKLIRTGEFYSLPFFERFRHVRRINKLYRAQLGCLFSKEFRSIKLAGALLLLSAVLGVTSGYAQSNSNSRKFSRISFKEPVKNPFGIELAKFSYFGVIDFADLDDDGDLDIIAGDYDWEYGVTLYYFKNEGTIKNPSFSRPTSYVFGMDGIEDTLASPEFVDIDGDGDYDLFVQGSYNETLYLEDVYFSGYGTLYFYENTGNKKQPRFVVEKTDPFGVTIKTGKEAFAIPYYVAKSSFVDIDDDGDYDLFRGAYAYYNYSSGSGIAGPILYHENIGSSEIPVFAAPVVNRFNLHTESLFPEDDKIPLPEFVDIDNDGDYDAFVGLYCDSCDYGRLFYYENIGSPENPLFGKPVESPFGIVSKTYLVAVPSFADIDGDGDFDLFLGECEYGNVYFYENTSK
jgi:large repetitive protein